MLKIKTHYLTFKYFCYANGMEILPCYTSKDGTRDVEPVDVLGEGSSGDRGRERARTNSQVGWSGSSVGAESKESESKEQGIGDGDDGDEDTITTLSERKSSLSREHAGDDDFQQNELSDSSAALAYDKYSPLLPRGVTHNASDDTYSCGIMINGKFLNLGTYDSLEDASAAYQRGREKYARK